MRKFETADLVRHIAYKGIFEVADVYSDKLAYDCTITNNECDSERYVWQRDLILVCSVRDRMDL